MNNNTDTENTHLTLVSHETLGLNSGNDSGNDSDNDSDNDSGNDSGNDNLDNIFSGSFDDDDDRSEGGLENGLDDKQEKNQVDGQETQPIQESQNFIVSHEELELNNDAKKKSDKDLDVNSLEDKIFSDSFDENNVRSEGGLENGLDDKQKVQDTCLIRKNQHSFSSIDFEEVEEVALNLSSMFNEASNIDKGEEMDFNQELKDKISEDKKQVINTLISVEDEGSSVEDEESSVEDEESKEDVKQDVVEHVVVDDLQVEIAKKDAPIPDTVKTADVTNSPVTNPQPVPAAVKKEEKNKPWYGFLMAFMSHPATKAATVVAFTATLISLGAVFTTLMSIAMTSALVTVGLFAAGFVFQRAHAAKKLSDENVQKEVTAAVPVL